MLLPATDAQNRLNDFVRHQPGGVGVVWVDRDGVSYFSAGEYAANDARPITPDTRFEIGSVSKAFNALLLAASVRAGKVSLDDAAAKYLLPPDNPAQAELAKVTLLSLVTHTSGLPRLPFNIGPDPDHNADPYAAYDRSDLIAALRRHGPVAPAGRDFAYSNFGAAVLGQALAEAWGAPYATVLEAQVLRPLGMIQTTFALTGAPPPEDLAPGHANGELAGNWHFQAFAPAGGLISTARDLGRFLQAALGGEDAPLHAAITDALQPRHAVDYAGGKIGLGWFLQGEGPQTVAWHNGATAGYRSFVGFSRGAGRGVAVLTNLGTNVDALGFGLLGIKPPHPKSAAVKNAADYPGRYPLSPAFAIDITTRGGALMLQCTGQPKLGLREMAADRFAVVGVPAEVSFERDAEGKVVALVLHQNGADQRAPRGELPPAPREVVLPAGELSAYAGDYALAPAFALTITVQDGRIFAQATGQGKNEIFAKARDEFFLKVVDAQISFTRDASGRVVGLVLHQNGRDVPAKKIR